MDMDGSSRPTIAIFLSSTFTGMLACPVPDLYKHHIFGLQGLFSFLASCFRGYSCTVCNDKSSCVVLQPFLLFSCLQ